MGILRFQPGGIFRVQTIHHDAIPIQKVDGRRTSQIHKLCIVVLECDRIAYRPGNGWVQLFVVSAGADKNGDAGSCDGGSASNCLICCVGA